MSRLGQKHLRLRVDPDSVLRRVAPPVSVFGEALESFAERMLAFAKKHGGVGLAAPQVGVSSRIIVVGRREPELCLVNPEMVSWSSDYETLAEGCLSLPNRSFTVERHVHLRVSARKPNGKLIDLDADELLARVIQHELDHLNGILILDKGNELMQS